MNIKLAVLLAAPVVLSACAPMPVGEDEFKEEKVYVTGSNLPQRGGSANLGQMSKDDLETLRRHQGTVSPPKN